MMRMSLRGLHVQRGASHTPLSQAPLFSSPMGTENSERLSKKPLMHASLHLARSDSVVIQSLSRVRLFAIPWTTARQASQSFTFLLSLLKLMSTESVTPSNHLILCHPFSSCPQSFPALRSFSNESVLHIRWSKYQSFSFSISPSNEYSGLISFRMDWLDLLVVQRDSRESSPAPQLKMQGEQELLFQRDKGENRGSERVLCAGHRLREDWFSPWGQGLSTLGHMALCPPGAVVNLSWPLRLTGALGQLQRLPQAWCKQLSLPACFPPPAAWNEPSLRPPSCPEGIKRINLGALHSCPPQRLLGGQRERPEKVQAQDLREEHNSNSFPGVS